jgi:hypothetical protein
MAVQPSGSTMYVAGVLLSYREVHDLVEVVDEPTASALKAGLDLDARFVPLSVGDRGRVLEALEIPWTNSLASLRSVLVRDQAWNVG